MNCCSIDPWCVIPRHRARFPCEVVMARCEAIIARDVVERAYPLERKIFAGGVAAAVNNQINALQSHADTLREEEILI
jgi:hypothetical protein